MSHCPSCNASVETPLAGWSPRCASCQVPLRSPLVAVLMSLAFPGLGHWYLRRRALAVVEMALGLGMLAAALAHMVMVFLAVVEETRPTMDILRVVLWWTPALVGYSVLSGLFTWLVSRRRVVVNAEKSRDA